MKKLFGMVMMACLLTACNNSIQNSNERGDFMLAGYAQENWIIRDLNIPTENGMLNVKCYLDETANEVCKGTFADGNEASAEQLDAALSATFEDKGHFIADALKDGCENKTLLLNLELKTQLDMPDMALCFYINSNNHTIACDGEIVSMEEAEKRNNAYRDALSANMTNARNEALDQFISLNPGVVSKESETIYRTNAFSALEIKLPACDYEAFIEKSRPILYIVEFRGIVDDFFQETCDSPLDYKVLLNNREFWMEQCNETPTYTALNSQEDLNNYLKDADDYLKQYIQSSKLNEIDFEHSTVLVLFGGSYGSTAYPLNVETVCKDAPINVYIDHCVGKPEDTSMSCPLMILQAPKGEYNVNFVPRDLVCE